MVTKKRVFLGWQSLGKRLISETDGQCEKILLTDDENTSKKESRTLKIIRTENQNKYTYRELLSELREAEDLCIVGGLGAKNIESIVDLIEKSAAELKTIRCSAFVVMPFSFEGEDKMQSAKRALCRIEKFCDEVRIYENDTLIGEESAGVYNSLAKVEDEFTGKCLV